MLTQPIGLFEDTGKVVSVSLRTSVSEAAARMREDRVSAVLVVEAGALVGIVTEHDVVARVIAPGLDPARVCVDEVMTRDLLTGDPAMLLGHALVLMQTRGVRHLPVIDNGKPVGLVRARDALDPALEEFVCEAVRRERYR